MNAEAGQRHHPETIGLALRTAARVLEEARVEYPKRTAELLLGYLLGWERVRVLTHTEARLSADQWRSLRALVDRCAGGEPVQHLTEEQEFFGLSFRVTPDVLIPRPETEILVEKVLALGSTLGSKQDVRYVDVGTGSGCVAISLAHHMRGWRGCAVDISAKALEVARLNAERCAVANRIGFVCGDLLECFPRRPIFEFILSNPPYVAMKDEPTLPRNVREHEPGLALFGGVSGLEVIERLVPDARARLRASGYLLVEVGEGQSERVASVVRDSGLTLESILRDLQGIPRCVVARNPV